MPKLYALLVGINNYPGLPTDTWLDEAEGDVDRMYAFLRKHLAPGHSEIRILKGKDATKERVRKEFGIFSKADGQDVCLYYFAGHGCQLKSVPYQIAQLEKNSITPDIESTLLHDSRQNNSIGDLPDKVLGHWINTAMKGKRFSGPGHFVAIMDCCHAGHGTRIEEKKDKKSIRSITSYGGDIPLSLFEGYRQGDHQYGKVLNQPFIQIAAAGEDKTANDGAFTPKLTDTLESQGVRSSYANLMRVLGDSHLKDQHPNYYVNSDSAINLPFLGGLLR